MINADIPGVKEENISVEVENRILVIKATKEKACMHDDPATTIVCCERTAGTCTVSGQKNR